MNSAFGKFGSDAQQLINSFSMFATSSATLTKALESFPSKLDINGSTKVEVSLNGAEVLASIQPDIVKYINTNMVEAIKSYFRANVPSEMGTGAFT